MQPGEIAYEVLVASGDRWVIDSRYAAKTVAMGRAEFLLHGNQHDAVRVIRESGIREDVVFQQECTPQADTPITISPIEDAAVCDAPIDLTGFPARRTVGRVLRKYLDAYNLTALEVLHNHDHLRELRRTESLFEQAVHKVGSVQARALGEPAQARIDRLSRLVTELSDWTRDTRGTERFLSVVNGDGLTPGLRVIGTSFSEDARPFHICAVLAAYIGQARDWRDKLGLVFDLLGKRPDAEATALLDELCAEIMDGSNAVMEVLGPRPDLVSALRAMALLSVGRYGARSHREALLARFNTIMMRHDLPETRGVLLDRVARETSGTNPLTHEDAAADRTAFSDLVRDLVSHAGLNGGPAASEAVTRRARLVMGTDDGDLSASGGIAHILDLLSTPAAKIGYLLDLAHSEFGRKYRADVLGPLLDIVKPMSVLEDLLPPGSSREALAETVDDLRLRVGDDALGRELRTLIAKKLDGFLDEEPPAPREEALAAPKRAPDSNRNSRKYETGTVIFREAEPGDEAFAIVSGAVEISVGEGGDRMVIATLGRGEVFGEMALVDDEPRMATATAVKETQVYVVPQEVFKKRLSWLAEEDRLISHILETLVSRLRGKIVKQ